MKYALLRVAAGLVLLVLTTWGLMVSAPVLGLPNLSFDQSSGVVILAWLVYNVFSGYDDVFYN